MTAAGTPPAPEIDYIAASPDMVDLVHTLFVMRAGGGRSDDIMPAYSAQLCSFVEGSGSIAFPEGEPGHSSDIALLAPMLRAAPMALEGPVLNVGLSFTPLGWSVFSGLAADAVHDQVLPAHSVIADEPLALLEQRLAQARSGAITPKAYCRAIESMVRSVCHAPGRAPRADHLELIAAIDRWLASAFSPAVADLYASVTLGQRQVQRLCRRYYGVPPAQLVKRFRAIRAAMLLAHDDLPGELRDEVLAAYFDQAHLIHDVRRYTGRTPRTLAHEPLAQDLLDPEGHGQTASRLRPAQGRERGRKRRGDRPAA